MMDTPKNAVEAIGNPIHEAMVSCGITPEILAKKLSEELEAEETVFAKFQGKIMDQTDVIAWKVRQEARKDAHRLFGHYPAERHDVNVDGEINVNIVKYSDSDFNNGEPKPSE